MPSKNEILLKYCKDLQALDAEHDAQVAQLQAQRSKRIADVPAGRPLIEAAEAARKAAATELSADRERAAAARDAAMASAAEKRRESLAGNEQAWGKAERAAERTRDDRRTDENRKHQDALEKIATLPLSQQAVPRAEEVARHTEALARIQADFDTAWDRARQDYQAANESTMQTERHASELANDAYAEAIRVAELHYENTLDDADSKLHDALLKCKETRAIEEEMEQRGRDIRERWQEKRVALHAQFKKDYDSAPSLLASKARSTKRRRGA